MANDDPNYPIHAPGWQAIDRACTQAYPGQVPHQFSSNEAYQLEAQNPLPAIGVWESSDPAAWHYVTYGLSELFEKSSPLAHISGFGFELSFKIPRAERQDRPPQWPLQLLQGIGHYVMTGEAELDTGHIIDLGGPIVGPEQSADITRLEGVICVPDSSLGRGGQLETPHGRVLFLLLVGLSRDELSTLHDWDLQRKVGLINEITERGTTDPGRTPWSQDPRRATVWRRYEMKILV